MYANLHLLPPGHFMFTVYVAPKGTSFEGVEQYDVVVEASGKVVDQVIDCIREGLVGAYGPTVEVVGMVNQSTGDILFDARQTGHVPLPVVVPARLAVTTDYPYNLLLSLAADGGLEYRDWLLEVTA